jgi:hypothetical protein
MYEDDEVELDRLFAAYREAVPAPEPGPAFMPGVWAKIDSRRRYAKMLRRLTGLFVASAAALSLMMAIYIARPPESPADLTTYVDTLDEDEIYYTVAYFDASAAQRQGFDVR